MLGELTGTELNKAFAAVEILLAPAVRDRLDHVLAIKLDSLRADILAEQEDRRKLARS